MEWSYHYFRNVRIATNLLTILFRLIHWYSAYLLLTLLLICLTVLELFSYGCCHHLFRFATCFQRLHPILYQKLCTYLLQLYISCYPCLNFNDSWIINSWILGSNVLLIFKFSKNATTLKPSIYLSIYLWSDIKVRLFTVRI